MPLYIDDPIKVIVKADPITVITTGTTSDGVVDGAYLSGATLVLERTQGLPDVTADLSALSGDTSMYVETSTFTGYTATTETTLSGLRTDVNTVSGQTDTNTSDIQLVSGVTETNETNISQNTADIAALSGATGDYVQTSDFDTYTGDTDTRLQGIESDLATVSGQTDTNTSAIGDNAADIVYLSGQTDNKLDSVVAGTNVTVDNTDPNNPIVSAVISGATDGVVTGATMNGNTLELERSNLPDVTVDLSQFDESSDITYLSGQTDLKLDITDFNVYTGDTETALNAKASETDLQLVSGVTTTNANNISNNATGITANTASIETKADLSISIVSITGATTLDSTHNGKMIECDGTFTLTLPTGVVDGWNVSITNVGSGTITLDALGTLQTKGSATDIADQYAGVTAYHRGSNIIIAVGDLS